MVIGTNSANEERFPGKILLPASTIGNWVNRFNGIGV
jgi:hypothetical protein